MFIFQIEEETHYYTEDPVDFPTPPPDPELLKLKSDLLYPLPEDQNADDDLESLDQLLSQMDQLQINLETEVQKSQLEKNKGLD